MRDLARKGIALEFTIGLVLTVAMLITALVIFSDIFSYESEAKGHESFVRLVALMHEIDQEPEGTRDSVLLRLPNDWAIIGFDGTPLEAVRVLQNGMVVQRRAYLPDTPECGADNRCICLVKNLDVAQTIHWERTLRCVNLGEDGEDIRIPHYTNVGTEEYTVAGRTMTSSFAWKGGFVVIESEDDWSSIWDPFPGIDVLAEQAVTVAAPVFVEKTAGGHIAVCTNRDTCAPERSEELHRRRNRAIEQYHKLERSWEELLTRRGQIQSIEETEALHADLLALMQNYDAFLASRDYMHLTQYQQDMVYTQRRLAAQHGEAWDKAIQYTDEALHVVQDENMRQTAQTAKDVFDCEARETLDHCMDFPPVCAWIQGGCVRLQSIRIPDTECSSRQNEGDCLFEHPRLCRWVVAAIGDRCESAP